MVMVSWVYAYLQTRQIVYIKHVQIFVYESCLKLKKKSYTQVQVLYKIKNASSQVFCHYPGIFQTQAPVTANKAFDGNIS